MLLGQLKLPSALQLAKAYMYNPKPFTADLQALQEKYGQPRQLIQSELGAILNPPTPLMHLLWSSQALVGMLKMLEGQKDRMATS